MKRIAISFVLAGLVLVGLVRAAVAVEGRPLKLYVFGNSLIHHLSDSDETTVPYWLAWIARADGRDLAVDGQWGFLRDFARPGAPLANWSFRQVPGAWGRGGQGFGAVGWDAIMINPANFIQARPVDAPYEGDNPDGASPLSAMLAVMDAHAGAAPVYIYEGWADMSGDYPPSARQMAAYHALNQGAYHDWYEGFAARLRAERPGREIVLIPVARQLSELLSAAPLEAIPATALYADDAPHGTATLYFLAAAAVYPALYGRPLPAGLSLPASIHPLVRGNLDLIAAQLGGGQAARSTSAEAASVAGDGAGQAVGVAEGLADPSLAMGLNGIADWSTQHPFVDLMKTARPWVGHEGEHWGAWDAARLEAGGYLDAEGWPLRLPPGVDRMESFILTDQPEAATALAGRYRVTWAGEGSLKIGGRARRVEYGAQEAWFSYSPGEGLVALILNQTDPRGVGAPIRDIRVVREDQIPLDDLGVVFNPGWIARIADLRGLRFMDWMMTNGSPVTGWAGRARPGDYTYARRGVPVEVMVDLANRVGADPWVNMPHAADDDYSERFAEYVKANLDPRLRVFVEYSNEVWNHGFPQAQWAAAQARARWGTQAGGDAWMQFAGMRAAEVMRAWGGVFSGADADRLVRVVAVHTGWMGLEEPLLNAPLWMAEAPGVNLSPAAHFDAYAVSGYFGYELGSDEAGEGRLADLRRWIEESAMMAEARARQQGLQRKALEAAVAPVRFDRAVAPAAEALRAGSLAELTGTLWPYHAGVAADRGLRLIMYEGGSHAVAQGGASGDDELTGFFTHFNYSPEMAALYRDELAAWRALGGEMFNAFVDVAPATKFGSWGALRHLQDDNPRWDALMVANAEASGEGARAPGAFLQGVLRRGGAGTDVMDGTVEEDILQGLEGDDLLISHGGNDAIDGGAGEDTARLPGRREAYRFALDGPRLLAIGAAGEVVLIGIEKLEFEAEPGRVYRLELPGD